MATEITNKRLWLLASQLTLILGIGTSMARTQSGTTGWEMMWPAVLALVFSLLFTIIFLLSDSTERNVPHNNR